MDEDEQEEQYMVPSARKRGRVPAPNDRNFDLLAGMNVPVCLVLVGGRCGMDMFLSPRAAQSMDPAEIGRKHQKTEALEALPPTEQ